MLDTIILVARGLQLLFALVVLGTSAYLVSQANKTYYDRLGNYYGGFVPSYLGFILFCAIWTFLVVAYQLLVPRFSEKLGHKFIILGVDAITMLFWFAGAIALAVPTGALTGPYLTPSYRTLQACVAFAFFSWVAFVVTTVLNALSVFRGNTSHKHRGGGGDFQANP